MTTHLEISTTTSEARRRPRIKNEIEKINHSACRNPVRLRAKQLRHGKKSLYLDIYRKGKRQYQFLELYLKNPKTFEDEEYNKLVFSQAREIVEQQLQTFNIVDAAPKITIPSRTNQGFCAYLKECARARLSGHRTDGNWEAARQHLMNFLKNKEISFAEIDANFLQSFKAYLLNGYHLKSKKKLKINSASCYLGKIKSALGQACAEGILSYDPSKNVSIGREDPMRQNLTLDEVQALTATPCKSRLVKAAFLFSVLTGLRYVDIKNLTWSNIEGHDSEGWYLNFIISKTKRSHYQPMAHEARKMLGVAQNPNVKVFEKLRYDPRFVSTLNEWITRAGIWKKITFHCARHTHATLLMEQGVDLYVLSKLLGHKYIQTTQIYTKVSLNKRKEAIRRIPKLNISNLALNVADKTESLCCKHCDGANMWARDKPRIQLLRTA